MAVQTITYGDKQYLNQNADIPATNKVQDVDMNEIKSVVNNNALEVVDIQNAKNYLIQTFSNASCTQNTSNNLAGLTLSKGTWVVVGNFNYSGNVLRYYMSLVLSNKLEVAHSCYDNAGVVAGNIVAIVNSEEGQNIVLSLWPTDKNIVVNGKLVAVKYQ